MTSSRRRDRGRGSGRRIDFRGGGILRRKRRPGSRDGGYLRSERRPGPDDGSGTPEAGARDGSAAAGETNGDGPGGGPEVRIRRRDGRSSTPAARVTTLAALLFFVLALIFLL